MVNVTAVVLSVIAIVCFLIALWISLIQVRARRQGLPPPPWTSYIPFVKSSSISSNYPAAPRRGGPVGWIKDKWANLQSHRAGPGYAGARRSERGFGPLDPDAAWDDRVGAEADHAYGGAGYEEQELGLHPPATGGQDAGPYGMHGGGFAGSRNVLPGYGEERGRSRSREDLTYVGGSQRGLDERYEEVAHGKRTYGGDDHEDGGLRAMSPKPHELDSTSLHVGTTGKDRHSMFREEI